MELMSMVEESREKFSAIRNAVENVIYGQGEVVANSVATIIAGGHMLLIGVPGLAKTRLVTTLGKVLGLDTRRVQCTPDLMPSDIIGAEVLEEVDYGKRGFRFVHGPVFCNLLMVDEINRASPRTQSALLQAMQEHNVTIAGREHTLPSPFHVLATQNPIEQEGTYPLPEAQLDRFLMQIDVLYPDLESEKKMLSATVSSGDHLIKSVIDVGELRKIQQLVRRMPLGEKVTDGILSLVRNGRPESSNLQIVRENLVWGPGPRASQALSYAARARALMDGRLSPSMDDVIALAFPVMRHRMALGFHARAGGMTVDDVLREMIKAV